MSDVQDWLELFQKTMIAMAENSDDPASMVAGFERLIAEIPEGDLPLEVAQSVAALEASLVPLRAIAAGEPLPAGALPEFEPDPQIITAVENEDIAGIHAALATCDVNDRYGEYGATALYRAMSNSPVSLQVIEALLDAGADPRIGVGAGNVLHGLGFGFAGDLTGEDLSVIVKRCVALGADLEQRTENLGWTPLILAASEWNAVACEALILAGADVTARAGANGRSFGAGETALYFAEGDAPTRTVLERYTRAM